MRILASRKRDSVTGEEVVVAVTRVPGSSGEYICSFNGIVADNVGLLEKSSDSLRVGCIIGNVPSSDSSGGPNNVAGKHKTRKERENTDKKGITSSHASWKRRISKGLSFFGCVLDENSYTRKEDRERLSLEFQDTYHLQNLSDSKEDTTLPTKKVEHHHDVKTDTELATSELGNRRNTEINSENAAIIADLADAHSNSRDIEANPDKVEAQNPLGANEIEIPPRKFSNIDVSASVVNVDTRTNSPDCDCLAIGTADDKIMRAGIYHEKQVKSLCALHALNNLLQDSKAFKQEDLDKICSELDPNSWVNPHKSVFGLGNYDINVIMTALQQKQLEAIWFDKRKDPSEELNFDNIYGFILNIPSDCRLGWLALPIKRKHWVAIRNLPSITEKDAGRSNYYNLDSKFDKPESIGAVDNLIDYLRGELKSPEKELFLVVTEDVGKVETWRKNPPPTSLATASGMSTHLLPVLPAGESSNCPDASAGSGTNRRTSNDSGVVDLLPDLKDINVVDLNKEDLMRRQSSGVWSDLT